jgi:hypothetical protein
MVKHVAVLSSQVEDKEWVGFPGGELEGERPRALCPSCRGRAPVSLPKPHQPLCFQCYRLALDRDRALRAAGCLHTASEERFQTTLPFEAVDVPRLERLRAERATARAELKRSTGGFEDKRRHAQIAARHALQRVSDALATRDKTGRLVVSPAERHQQLYAAAHAAELQLPEAWLPFVLAR